MAYTQPDLMQTLLSSRKIRISKVNGDTVLGKFNRSPAEMKVKEMIDLVTSYSIPSSLSDGVLQLCSACLADPEKSLWDELVMDYSSFVAPRCDDATDIKPFSVRISEVITLCAIARTLLRQSARPSWSTLYNSMLFLLAKTDGVLLSFSAVWALHRPLEPEIDTHQAPDRIIVDAFFMCKDKLPFRRDEFLEYPTESRAEFRYEFAVEENPDAVYHGGPDSLDIPLLLVEHVKSSSPEAHECHLAHLSMAMKSVLGLYNLLKLPPVVFGVLCDRNAVTLIVSYEPNRESRESITVAVKSFNVCKPMEALALRMTLKNYVQHGKRLKEHVSSSMPEIAAS